MTFHKVAKVRHLGTFELDAQGHQKAAQLSSETKEAQQSYYMDGSAKVDVGGILRRRAADYAISDKPGDYIFEVIRANTTSVFNDNHDGFSREELLRFDPRLKTAVYLTYREKPHHVNHRADNPKRARGILLDAHYNAETTSIPECPGCKADTSKRANRDKSGIFCKRCATVVTDEFPEILVAVDKRKDPAFARAVQSGQLRFGSMGCTCAETVCNVCDNVARTRAEFCSHIASHKGSYWIKKPGDKDWNKVNPRTAEQEMKRRKRAFHQRDFVRLVAEDGTEVRKAAEWCQGVIFDEYSRVHMPADPKAERIELLSKAAKTATKPTPDDLEHETARLIAAAVASKGRRHTAAQERTAMKFFVVRVDGDPMDTFAAESLEMALEMAQPDAGSQIDVAEVEAEDAGAARLMADDADFQPHMGAEGEHQLEGDVIINIEEGANGESIDFDPETETDLGDDETSIEDFSDELLEGPENETPADEEFSPEELGVMPASANKEAQMQHKASTYADWKVQLTPAGTAQVVAPSGPVLLISPKTALTTDKRKVAFGREVMDTLYDFGLVRTAEKYQATYHAKFASVVDHAIDDMREFMDKDTKSEVAGGGDDDMAGFTDRGTHVKDSREGADDDMADKRNPKVDRSTENGAVDHEIGQETAPTSSADDADDDMQEPRKPFNMSTSDSLENPGFDHARAASTVGHFFVLPKTGRVVRVASYAKDTGEFAVVDHRLAVDNIPAADLVKQWKQLDKAPANYEENLKRWAKAEIAKANKKARSEVFEALRIASQRAHKGLESSPLKEAVAMQLANRKVVGHDAVSHAPLEYAGMSDELAVHLVEAAFAEAGERDFDALLSRTAALLKHDTKYLQSAASDLQKQAHRVPVVTAASMVDDLDREAEVLRRSASAGNLELAPQPTEERSTRVASSGGKADRNSEIRSALGNTRAGARIQLRQ